MSNFKTNMKSTNRKHSLRLCGTLLAFGLFVCPSANAQSITAAVVIIEDFNESHPRCKVGLESTRAALEAALRFNRIQIVKDNFQSGSTMIYLNINPVKIGDFDACAAGISIEFGRYGRIIISETKKEQVGWQQFCRQGQIVTDYIRNIQSHVNQSIKEGVDLCLYQVEKNFTKTK